MKALKYSLNALKTKNLTLLYKNPGRELFLTRNQVSTKKENKMDFIILSVVAIIISGIWSVARFVPGLKYFHKLLPVHGRDKASDISLEKFPVKIPIRFFLGSLVALFVSIIMYVF